MKHIQKIAFALVLSCACAFGQDTNFSTRLACELQTAGPASLADLTWQQGTTPHIAVAPLRMGRPVAVDALTTVRMIIGQSGIVTNYALATNWLATNSTYYVQWPTIGTNSAGTNAAAQAWWYTVHFERDGRRYWTGDGRLYIEPTTSTEDGLAWQEITAGAATDLVARAQIADLSNTVAGIEVGSVSYGVETNTAYRGDWGASASNLAAQAAGWGDHALAGYATGTPVYAETDPIFSATNAWLVRTNDSAYTATVAKAASAVQSGDTNGWVVSSHSGLATEAQAGQIATNVLSTATTNSMPLIDFGSGVGASPAPSKSLGASAVGWSILNTNNAPFVTIITDANMGAMLNFPLDTVNAVDAMPIVSDTSASITQLVFVARAYAAGGSEWGTVGLKTTFGGSILTNVITLTNAPTTQTVTLAHAPVSGPCVVPFSWGILPTSTVGTAVGNVRFNVMQARGSW